MSAGEALHPQIDRVQGRAMVVGLVGLAACAGAGLAWPRAFFPSYLVAILFWVGISVGCTALAMLHNLTGGAWGRLIRRPLEAGALTVVPMAVLFVGVALGMRTLYPWTDRAYVEAHETVLHKRAYLNETAFLLRAGVSFAIWIGLATLLNAAAARRDRSGGVAPGWLATISGPGLAAIFFTGSFAAIDWGMSLEPDWYSSIYGVMVIVGWGLLTFASMIVVTSLLKRASPEVDAEATPGRLQDLGNLMLAFTMLWAYLSFSQFLVIWAGNLAEETPWYLRRTRGTWQLVVLALIAFHFFAPFFALLFRDTKRSATALLGVAVGIIVMHLVDLSWLVLPARNGIDKGSIDPFPWSALGLVPLATIGIGGVWVWSFLWNLRRRPLWLAGNGPAVTTPPPPSSTQTAHGQGG